MKVAVGGAIKEVMKKYGRIVFEQDFTMPDGTVKDLFLFMASSVPAIVFPVTWDWKVLAIRQFRFGADKVIIETPGGNRKPGQTLGQCAREEVLEETGYEAKEIICLGNELWFDPASWRAHYWAFLAEGCRRVQEPKPDPTEMIEVMEVPLDEWLERIWRGEITDSKTIAVTFLALPHLGYHINRSPEMPG